MNGRRIADGHGVENDVWEVRLLAEIVVVVEARGGRIFSVKADIEPKGVTATPGNAEAPS